MEDDRTVPRWVAPAFGLAAAITVPWIVYLACSLPRRAVVYDRAAWVGFDIGLVVMLSATALLAWWGRPKVALTATATATMLIVDAWFDTLTSRRGPELNLAIALSVVELFLAGVCLWLARHTAAVVRSRMEAPRRPDRD
jgi:hypothetical protein